MAKKKLVVIATPSAGLKAYAIQVDGVTVQMANDRGSVNVDSAAGHLLTWQMVGNPGESLGIVGQVGDENVVQVKKSRVPPDRLAGAGVKPFAVPEGDNT